MAGAFEYEVEVVSLDVRLAAQHGEWHNFRLKARLGSSFHCFYIKT